MILVSTHLTFACLFMDIFLAQLQLIQQGSHIRFPLLVLGTNVSAPRRSNTHHPVVVTDFAMPSSIGGEIIGQ